ncbi:MAG: FadR/GntR family transcriptional regulator [Nocardioidaceae bacterium]
MVNWTNIARELVSVPERLSTELELMIIRGELPQGGRIPPERELASELGVSRASLREALHELELKGLLDRKPGRGTIVTRAERGPFADNLASALSDTQRDFVEVMELRAVVEPRIAARAAKHASRTDLVRMRDLHEQSAAVRTSAQFLEIDIQFHQSIAAAGQNPLVAQLLEVVNEWARSSRRLGLQGTSRRRLSMKAHLAILEAIEAGDEKAAETAMDDHIVTILEHVSVELQP